MMLRLPFLCSLLTHWRRWAGWSGPPATAGAQCQIHGQCPQLQSR